MKKTTWRNQDEESKDERTFYQNDNEENTDKKNCIFKFDRREKSSVCANGERCYKWAEKYLLRFWRHQKQNYVWVT